jgi:hypothetical protein
MSNPGLRPDQMQEAVDLLEIHGSIDKAAIASRIPRSTLKNRVERAQLNAFRPKVKAPPLPTPIVRERLGKIHMVIPDIQAKPDVEHDHLEWIANYALEKRPDVIVQIGDWSDMPSLSLYDKGKRCYEGRRYVKDIEAANYSLERFERRLEEYNRENPHNAFNPEKHLTLGNHEHRIVRACELDAALDGKLSLNDLDFERRGWKVHDFLEVLELDGIEYSHYFHLGEHGETSY